MYMTAIIDWYNNNRPHQSLGYQTPSEYYFGIQPLKEAI